MDADAYVRIVMPQNELNRDPLEKKDAMLELRPSCEHSNKLRHPTHIRHASAPIGPCPRGPGDQSTKKP